MSPQPGNTTFRKVNDTKKSGSFKQRSKSLSDFSLRFVPLTNGQNEVIYFVCSNSYGSNSSSDQQQQQQNMQCMQATMLNACHNIAQWISVYKSNYELELCQKWGDEEKSRMIFSCSTIKYKHISRLYYLQFFFSLKYRHIHMHIQKITCILLFEWQV